MIEIRKVLVLRGPNIWSRKPVVEALVDLGELKDSPSDSMPGFNERLMGWLPSMIEHRCSIGERGGFFERLRRGTYLAHILEHTTIELQTLAGNVVGFGKARETCDEGVYKVCFHYVDEHVAQAALLVARELCHAAVFDRPFDVSAEVQKLHAMANKLCLGPSTMAIVEAAQARNIPVRRLNRQSLVQLGQGGKQRRIWTAETDQTSAIAESIAQDKDLTKTMLRAAGIPVPDGRVVDDAEDAVAAAHEIDGPIVVKPLDANHGRGVFMNLTNPDHIRAAFSTAEKEGSGVIVEQFCPGSEHRLLVIGGKLVAAARGDAAAVIGDGVQDIMALIETQVNSDPRRGNHESCPLNPVLYDELLRIELEKQGYVPKSVPGIGVRVIVKRNDNLSMDCTDLVHPSIAEHAVMAARIVGLDIAGIDLVCEDVSQPMEQQGAGVVEVNAGPGLLPHLRPRFGKPRPVGEAIVNTMFPEGDNGRIPVVCVTGTNGKTTVSRLIAAMLKAARFHVGLATSDGITIDGRVIDVGDCAGPRSARNVLLNPSVTAAVLEAGRGGILREGLGFDKCDIAVITNIGEGDHLGQSFINSPEEMYVVKRCPVDVVMPHGHAVLNAADPLVAEMQELSDGGVIFFAVDAQHDVLRKHREAGKRVVTVEDGNVVLCAGGTTHRLARVADLPCTHGGRAAFQVENVLAAVGAAWGLNVSHAAMLEGLQSFRGNLQDDPARFNVFELAGKTLIAIDCRNASALRAVVATIQDFPSQKRTIVYSAEEDRRDVDIIAQAKILGTVFDEVVLCEIDDPHPQGSGRITSLFRQGLAEAGGKSQVAEIRDWSAAVDHAWKSAERGELVIVQSSTIPRTVRKLQSLLGLDIAEVNVA